MHSRHRASASARALDAPQRSMPRNSTVILRRRWRTVLIALAVACNCVAAGAGGGCSRECSCRAQETAVRLRQTHRITRKLAVGLETGAFETYDLEEVQTAVSGAVELVGAWQAACPAARGCNSSAPAALRRSCGCRPARLLNIVRALPKKEFLLGPPRPLTCV